MTRRLALGLGGALLSVLLAALWSARLSLRAHEGELERRAAEAAVAVRAAYERESKASRQLLQQACARDLQVERLALELGAGAGADPSRTALGLGRGLGKEVWLLRERERKLVALGASARLPTTLPSAPALHAAARGPRAFAAQNALVIAACARNAGPERLWVVASEPLSALQKALLPPLERVELIEPARALTGRAARGGDRADVLALRIPGVDDAPDAELWLRAREAPNVAALVPLAPLLALLVLFSAALAYVAALRPPIDDAVLLELEQAAERVAKGDLTARIGRRPGGRADQTFQTFDRMTAELQEMRTRLADAERAAAWQDMARRIAHEIKNPLSPIQLAIETLRKAHEKRLPSFDEIFAESTRAILEEVRRIERIVREFSEFARLPRARPGMFELGALVADTVALYEPDDLPVALERESAVEVRADREQITQVLVNLLQNALEAARAVAAPRVAVRVEAHSRAALIHVDDNGRGVRADERERVFEPYYTTKQHGTGLGLAIARRIALDHDGSVTVSDSPLGGARFTLRLPLAHSTRPVP